MSRALQRCLEECLKLITLSVIGNRFAVVAVGIRPPPARTKIGADAEPCHVLILLSTAGRFHCGGFQTLTEQILPLSFSHI